MEEGLKMNREKNLINNTLIITIGKVCTQLITFLLLPLYTGILSTEEYGVVDLLNTLVALVLPIVTFQVEKALFRELIEVRLDDKKKTNIISNSFFSVVIQCSIYMIFFFIIYPFVDNRYKIFLATNVLANIFSSLFLQIARGLGDNKKYSIGSFISAFSTIFFNVIFLTVMHYGVYGMLIGTLLGQITCIIYLFMTLKIYRYLDISKLDKKVVKKLWAYSVPLIPNAISWWVFNASDRVIVSSFLGLSSNGILAAATKFSSVYITLYNIFDISWTESVVVNIDDDDIENYFNKIFNIIMKIFIALAIGIIAFMPFVYPILINEKFAFGYNLVPILVIASLLNVVVGLISAIYVAKKNTKSIANTSIISALINIAVHVILIKSIGLYAAAVSTLVSFLTMSLYRLYDIRKKYFKVKFRRGVISSFLLVGAFTLFTYYVNNVYLNILTVLLSIIYAFMLNRDSVDIILNKIKKIIKKR